MGGGEQGGDMLQNIIWNTLNWRVNSENQETETAVLTLPFEKSLKIYCQVRKLQNSINILDDSGKTAQVFGGTDFMNKVVELLVGILVDPQNLVNDSKQSDDAGAIKELVIVNLKKVIWNDTKN